MKRIPLILSLALLLLLPVIALYPMLHASAEKDGVDSSTAIQEAAPSEAAPSEAAPSEAAPSEAAPLDSAVAAPAAVSGSIDTDGFPLTDGQQQALHRYMTAYYTRRRAPTAYSAPTTSPPMSRRCGAASWPSAPLHWRTSPSVLYLHSHRYRHIRRRGPAGGEPYRGQHPAVPWRPGAIHAIRRSPHLPAAPERR